MSDSLSYLVAAGMYTIQYTASINYTGYSQKREGKVKGYTL